MSLITAKRLNMMPFPKHVASLAKFKWPASKSSLSISWKDASELLKGTVPTALIRKASGNPEGYALLIRPHSKPSTKLIIGNSPRAIQYANMTARQLLELNKDDDLPEVLLIVDWPDAPIRGANRTLFCMKDIRKNWYFEAGLKKPEDVFKRMAELKLNTFLIHSEWGFGLHDLLPDGKHVNPFLKNIVSSAKACNLDIAMLMSHALELHTGKQNEGNLKITYACGLKPEFRAERLKLFEALVRALPEIRYWVIHSEEHPRCTCERCRKIPIGDEYMGYLRDYRKILKRTRPDGLLVAVPYYQIGYPYFHMNYFNGRWREVSDDLRTFWWTDNYPLRSLPQFMTDVSESLEPYVYARLPHVWHWFYMNGWVDFTFPCPEHFRSRIEAGLKSRHVEAFSGEQALYRGSEWNLRALAQFSWNHELSCRDFDSIVIRSWFKPKSVEALRRVVETYRNLLRLFLKTLFKEGHNWKNIREPEIIRVCRFVAGKTIALETAFIKAAGKGTGKPGDPVTDFITDLHILRHEMEVRIRLREGYMAWQKAETIYDRGQKAAGAKLLRQSIACIHAAETAWKKHRAARIARGNYHNDFMSAPMSKLERIFPDLVKTTEHTIAFRNKGFHGYRPRWKEWTEIESWIWNGYVTFH